MQRGFLEASSTTGRIFCHSAVTVCAYFFTPSCGLFYLLRRGAVCGHLWRIEQRKVDILQIYSQFHVESVNL